jgi:hypothetical protein
VIFRAPSVTASEFERVAGWHLKPEGLCREDRCVPFVPVDPRSVEVTLAARALGMPVVHDARHGLWALGAEAGGRALASAAAPDPELTDRSGSPFRLSSLRGQKVVLVAWASW